MKFEFNGPVVSEENMFENFDGRTHIRTMDDGVTGILIANLGAFGSGELKIDLKYTVKPVLSCH